MTVPWILITILVVIVLFGVLAFVFRGKKKQAPDYYTFFVIGIIWLAFSIFSEESIFFLLGLVFALTGLAHKSEWKKNHVSYNKKENMVWLILGLLLLLGLILFYLMLA